MALTDRFRTKAYSTALGEATSGTPKADGTFSATSRTKVRRRPAFLALGIALILVFAVGAAALVNGLRQTTTVLVAATDIAQGTQLGRDDLTTAVINSDAAISSIAADQIDTIVGTSAAVAIPAGTVVAPHAVTEATIPPVGQTLVGITVAYAKLPGSPMQPGDRIRLVDTPRDQDDAPVQEPVKTNAQVVAIRDIVETGQTTVDVLVPALEAGWVAARAATGRVAIVLDSDAGTIVSTPKAGN